MISKTYFFSPFRRETLSLRLLLKCIQIQLQPKQTRGMQDVFEVRRILFLTYFIQRGSHPSEYQKRRVERESQRNGEADESPPPPKRSKVATTSPVIKVIKQEPTAPSTPKKPEYPCRYCDKVLTRADNRDKHEATHKDIRAFGGFFE